MNDSGPYPNAPTYPTHSPGKIKLPNDSETKLLTIKLEKKKFKLPNDDDEEEAKLVRKLEGKKKREKEKEGCQ